MKEDKIIIAYEYKHKRFFIEEIIEKMDMGFKPISEVQYYLGLSSKPPRTWLLLEMIK